MSEIYRFTYPNTIQKKVKLQEKLLLVSIPLEIMYDYYVNHVMSLTSFLSMLAFLIHLTTLK